MGHTVFMTGATGFIGYRMAMEILQDKRKRPIAVERLILLVRDKEKAQELYGKWLPDTEVETVLLEGAVETMGSEMTASPIDYIIHCASVTQSAEMVAHPVEVADGIVLGTRNVLELAYKKQVKSMVYLSSMEVYGKVESRENLGSVGEAVLGDVDIGKARSCYPMGKRMAEHYCHVFFEEYGVPVKVARLSQTFGRGVPMEDNRVFAQFARAVIEGKDIVLHTPGMSMGNYCGAGDTVNGLWTILLAGSSGEAYNVVNERNTMRIRDMAQLVADRVAGGKIKVVCDMGKGRGYGYAPDTELRLSSEKLGALGWQPTESLEEMYRELTGWYQELLVCN